MKEKGKSIVAVICGVAVIIVLIGGFLLLSKNNENQDKDRFESYSGKLLKRAESGDAEAQHKLGNCFYYGLGVKQDYREAVKWFRKAADQHYAPAENDLGFCYHEGYGVEQSDEEADKWWKKAVEH